MELSAKKNKNKNPPELEPVFGSFLRQNSKFSAIVWSLIFAETVLHAIVRRSVNRKRPVHSK